MSWRRRLGVAALTLAGCRSEPREHAAQDAASASPSLVASAPDPGQHAFLAPPAPGPEPPQSVTDWCVDGLAALDEETCYLLPESADAAASPRRLLIYLHGIVPPTKTSAQKERVQSAVLHAATRANAAALVPRGVRGIGPGTSRDWWAWPTEPGAHAKHAAAIVAKWASAKRRLEALAGAPFARTYLAGSSNGAYFLTALALGGDLERLGFSVDAYGAISGGSAGGRAAASLTSPARRFYVGHGTYDEETRPSSRALTALLTAAHWPVLAAEHPFAHGAREEYLDEAFPFWDGAPSGDR